jgi:hypothetical protein
MLREEPSALRAEYADQTEDVRLLLARIEGEARARRPCWGWRGPGARGVVQVPPTAHAIRLARRCPLVRRRSVRSWAPRWRVSSPVTGFFQELAKKLAATVGRLSGGAQAAVVVGLLVGASAAGLVVQAMAGMTRRVFLGAWTWPRRGFARWRIARRRARWHERLVRRRKLEREREAASGAWRSSRRSTTRLHGSTHWRWPSRECYLDGGPGACRWRL